MEAIGGQGAHSAGKILAEAAVLDQGYSGNHFSSFGSEKRGSPVKSNVRFSTQGQPIRSASTISAPDVLAVFHASLLTTHPEVLEGAHARTTLVINTAGDPADLHFPQGFIVGDIVAIDATEIARATDCGLNAAMLGAISVAVHEIPHEKIRDRMDAFFKSRGEKVTQSNRRGFERAREKFVRGDFVPSHADQSPPARPLPVLGWKNSPAGGVITSPGNSVLKDHSASRKGLAPRLQKETCFHCGYCDMVCPDFCFVWTKDADGAAKLEGIDYQYCKGCQKCVEVCPVQALTPVAESTIPESERAVKLFPDVNAADLEREWRQQDTPTFADKLEEES